MGVLITSLRNSVFIKDNHLHLKFFLLLTSQRELFPKLSPYGDIKGTFKPIRVLSSSLSNSRKSSFIQNDAPETSAPAPRPMPPTTTAASGTAPLQLPFIQDGLLSVDSTYSGICDEKINYLGFFNAHEIVMQRILSEKVNETKEQLKRIISIAEIDCRRDCLWNSLIPANHGQMANLSISLEELNELLTLVKSIRLDEYDDGLSSFYSFNYQWYKSLAQKLELKFECTHRKFQAKDNTHFKMVPFRLSFFL